MFKSLLLFGGLVCSIGLGVNNVSVSNDLHYESNETIELKASPKLASYDDENFTITLTADELNNYIWENLNNYLLTLTVDDLDNSYLIYDEQEFSYTYFGLSNQHLLYHNDEQNENRIAFRFTTNEHFEDSFKWYLYNNELFNLISFDGDVVWHVESNTYQSIKTAIELDISAYSESMPQASDLFGYITQGATQFASALGQAFTSITAMIWDSTNSAPTFLGMVLLLSIGAGLIYLAFNIIRGLVRRLRG